MLDFFIGIAIGIGVVVAAISLGATISRGDEKKSIEINANKDEISVKLQDYSSSNAPASTSAIK